MNRNEKINVAFAIPAFQCGGAERVFLHILSNIDREKFNITIVCHHLYGDFTHLIPKDLEIVELTQKQSAIRNTYAMIRAINKIKPDIILSTLGSVITVALSSFFIPNNITIISRLGNTISSDLQCIRKDSFIKYLYAKMANWIVCKRTTVLITQCNYMMNDLLKVFPNISTTIRVIYNPVPSKSLILKENFFAAKDSPIRILSSASLLWRKGYDFLLPAFREVLCSYPNAQLDIAGKGPLEAELKHMAKTLGISASVNFLGYVDQPLLNNSYHLLVSSSRYEGFSNTIIEAMSQGIPVVATNCPGGNAEVISDGVNGWLCPFENNNAPELGKYIIKAISSLHTINMSIEGKKIQDRFSISKITKEYENLLYSLGKEK